MPRRLLLHGQIARLVLGVKCADGLVPAQLAVGSAVSTTRVNLFSCGERNGFLRINLLVAILIATQAVSVLIFLISQLGTAVLSVQLEFILGLLLERDLVDAFRDAPRPQRLAHALVRIARQRFLITIALTLVSADSWC